MLKYVTESLKALKQLATYGNFLSDSLGCTLLSSSNYVRYMYAVSAMVTSVTFLHSTGIIAVSCGEGLSFDDRVDNFSRILMTSSLVLIWSFSDPIHPLVCAYLYIPVHTCVISGCSCVNIDLNQSTNQPTTQPASQPASQSVSLSCQLLTKSLQ